MNMNSFEFMKNVSDKKNSTLEWLFGDEKKDKIKMHLVPTKNKQHSNIIMHDGTVVNITNGCTHTLTGDFSQIKTTTNNEVFLHLTNVVQTIEIPIDDNDAYYACYRPKKKRKSVRTYEKHSESFIISEAHFQKGWRFVKTYQ